MTEPEERQKSDIRICSASPAKPDLQLSVPTSLWNMNKRCSSKAPQPLRRRRRTFTLRRFHPQGCKMKVKVGDGSFVWLIEVQTHWNFPLCETSVMESKVKGSNLLCQLTVAESGVYACQCFGCNEDKRIIFIRVAATTQRENIFTYLCGLSAGRDGCRGKRLNWTKQRKSRTKACLHNTSSWKDSDRASAKLRSHNQQVERAAGFERIPK